jgi:hypothetical protein
MEKCTSSRYINNGENLMFFIFYNILVNSWILTQNIVSIYRSQYIVWSFFFFLGHKYIVWSWTSKKYICPLGVCTCYMIVMCDNGVVLHKVYDVLVQIHIFSVRNCSGLGLELAQSPVHDITRLTALFERSSQLCSTWGAHNSPRNTKPSALLDIRSL